MIWILNHIIHQDYTHLIHITYPQSEIYQCHGDNQFDSGTFITLSTILNCPICILTLHRQREYIKSDKL